MPSSLPDVFSQVLREHRERKGWGQMELAMEASLHLNAVGNLERKQHNPNLQTIFLLCRALGITPSQLIAEVEKKSPSPSDFFTLSAGLLRSPLPAFALLLLLIQRKQKETSKNSF